MTAAILPTLLVSSWFQQQLREHQAAMVQEKHLLIAKNLSLVLEQYAQQISVVFNGLSHTLVEEHPSEDLAPLLEGVNIYALAEWQLGRGQRFFYGSLNPNLFVNPPVQLQVAIEQARKHRGQVIFSGVVVEGLAQPSLILCVYQGDDRYWIGALGTQYFLKTQAALNFGEQGHAAIFDQYARVLAHPNPQWYLHAENLSELSPLAKMRKLSSGVDQFYSPALQKEMIAGFARVESTGWRVIVPQPLAELQLQSLELQRYAFIVSLVCLLLVGLVTWFLACMIVSPIRKVVETAEEISQGEMGKYVQLNRWCTPVEIAALESKFNAMAGEVYTSRTLLEQRVKQRTAALSKEVAVRKKAQQQIWQQANFDPLTKLPNRRMINRLLNDAIASRNGEQRVALMLLDLDQFKGINDTLGHDMGDMLLQIAAQRIQHCIAEGEHVARLGGDEFVILLNEQAQGQRVAEVGEAVLQTLNTPFQLGIERVYISTSIGVSFAPDDGDSIDDLLKHADQAMYVAKQQGRNRLSYFTASLQEQAQVRRMLANDLRQAVAKNQLHLHYQPIVELSTGRLIKAEVLVRWLHPQQGWISPSDFIHIAEETGIVLEMGNWIFSQAVAQLKVWKAQGMAPIQLTINTSPKQYYETEFDVAQWLQELQDAGLSSADVVMEITEGLLMENSPQVDQKLLALSEAGVAVALDDFGTGYSSLAYLQKFDIEFLKIDRMFIENLAQDGDDLAVCKAIIVMAHKLGIEVIAEGIETALQATLLEEAGCDYAQGFWFSEPLNAQAFSEILAGQVSLLPPKC